jgi:ankyrin repeat protein
MRPVVEVSVHIRTLFSFHRKMTRPISLHEAAAFNDKATFDVLLRGGHDITLKDEQYGGTVLHMAVLRHVHEIFNMILSHKDASLLIEAQDGQKMTPLHIAAGTKNMLAYHALLAHGASLEARDQDQNTPLHLAVEVGATDIARDLIIHRKINVNSQGECGWTPLHIAAKEGRIKMAELLVQQGHASIDAKSDDGSTPLYLACHFRRQNMVLFLVDTCHADLHQVNHQGSTLLHAAAAGDPSGMYETFVLDFLIEKGLKLDVPDKEGRLPRDLVTHYTLKRLLSPDREEAMTSLFQRFFFPKKPSSTTKP